MANSILVDRVKLVVLSSGTGPFAAGPAVQGFRGVEALADGATYSYAVELNALYEVGQCVYNLSTGQLLRTPQLSSNGNAAVAFPAGVELNFTARAADLTAIGGTFPIVNSLGSNPAVAIGQQAATDAINAKEPAFAAGSPGQYFSGNKSWQNLNANAVGLGNVNNTADSAKPVSGPQQTALNAKVSIVTSRTALKALAVDTDRVAFLSEGGRSGEFCCFAGSPPSDTQEGIYVVSNTAGYYWARTWSGLARPEWFGAQPGNGAFDSYLALQGCLNVTNTLFLSGNYYGTRGLQAPAAAVVRGIGALLCGYSVSHATDHLLRQDGVSGSSYLVGGDFSDFALGRSVNPTTPGSTAADLTQGHGLHFFMVTNPRVRSVYTYNNLIECYLGNVLSPDVGDVRGLRQTGGAGDRWSGLYVDGVTAGGTFGGPSPNPSTTIRKPNMIAYSGVGSSINYNLVGALQDLWIVDPEAAGGHTQFFVNSNGGTAGDFHIVRPIADGYKTFGIYVKGVPLGSSLEITGAWVAPAAGATSSGVRIEASHGVQFQGRGDFSSASGLIGVQISDSTTLDIDMRTNQCQSPVYAVAMQASLIKIHAQKDFSGSAFGNIFEAAGGSRNRVILSATKSGTQAYANGFAVDATASGYLADVSAIQDNAATNRVSVNGTPVTTQGAVGAHNIFNPGAGAML